MGVIFIILSLLAHQCEAIIVKQYGKKYGKGGMFFNAIICLCAMIYFTISELLKKEYFFYFPKELWAYGIISGIFYAVGFYAAYMALKLGSFGITRLLSSFGTIIPIIYGVIFLKETATKWTFLAVILIMFSMFLMNYQKSTDEEKDKISLKWIVCIVSSVIANAGISIIAKAQQIKFGTMCSNEFLIISYAIAIISLLVLGIVYERNGFKATVKNGLLYGVFAGAFNGMNNVLIILTYLYIPISIVSPVKTALSLVISFLISVFLYKEKFTRRQLISVVIGIMAVVLINIKG